MKSTGINPQPTHPLTRQAIDLLCRLVATPSVSGNEHDAADLLAGWLSCQGAAPQRLGNNVYALGHMHPGRPVLMLNSHIDTVKPSPSYTRDPFAPVLEDSPAGTRLYGLGSNDAGAAAVALACTFVNLMHRTDLAVNLLLALTASEENMAPGGMRAFLPHLRQQGLYPDMALVGEPTGLDAAVAERGLLVLDGVARGVSGHAARNEGVNAIYNAIDDIAALRAFAPPVTSSVLGPIKVSVTMIRAGAQHNVVPDECRYVADVRTTDAYTNAQTAQMLADCISHGTLTPRSTRVQASVIDSNHALVKAAVAAGARTFVSPTTSDMALMHGLPSLKIGPGDSCRSHTADEYVYTRQIDDAMHTYNQIILNLKQQPE